MRSDGILSRVKRRTWQSFLPLLAPLVSLLLIAQARPQAGAQAPAGAGPGVAFDGRELPLRATIAASGPLLPLAPLAQSLGGDLKAGETGESFALRIGEKDIILGIGSAVVTVGDSVSLSQPPVRGEGGVLVPWTSSPRPTATSSAIRSSGTPRPSAW